MGGSRRSTAFTRLKMALLAPIPRASEATATRVNPGRWASRRAEYWTFFQNWWSIPTSPRLLRIRRSQSSTFDYYYLHEARGLSPRAAPLRALPYPPARKAEPVPRRKGGHLGEARGLQFRPRVRWQQGSKARVPRRRSSVPGLRHPGLDRRNSVEPHAPGGRGRRAPRPRRRAGPGALGRLVRPGIRPRRGHSSFLSYR